MTRATCPSVSVCCTVTISVLITSPTVAMENLLRVMRRPFPYSAVRGAG
jgi:hypothetical protein